MVCHAVIGDHQCGDYTALPGGGRTPPPVVPIHSPHEPASGGNENSPGGAPPRGPACTPSGMLPSRSAPIPAQRKVALACLFAIPAGRPPPAGHTPAAAHTPTAVWGARAAGAGRAGVCGVCARGCCVGGWRARVWGAHAPPPGHLLSTLLTRTHTPLLPAHRAPPSPHHGVVWVGWGPLPVGPGVVSPRAALVVRCLYHLAHGRLTRIQRLFGAETCSTPVLNRTQRGLCSSPSPDGVLATATKICAGGRAGGGQPPRGPRASVSFLHCQCSAGERGGGARRARVTGPRRAPGPPAASAVDCGTNSASLTWAPSVFGAARFGR